MSIHNSTAVQNILSRKNITLVKVPTYSYMVYDLNPMETAFSVVNANALTTPGAIHGNRMVSIMNAFAGVTVPVEQSRYHRSWQV